jgi:hypothetical protein
MMEEAFDQNREPSPPAKHTTVVQASSVPTTSALSLCSLIKQTASLVDHLVDTSEATVANYKCLYEQVCRTVNHEARMNRVLDQQTAIFDDLTGIDKGICELMKLMSENEVICYKRCKETISLYDEFQKN